MNRAQRRGSFSPRPSQTAKAFTPVKKGSVMLDLENAVLSLEKEYSEEEIYKFVHLICLGLIRGGELTEEYVELAAKAKEKEELIRMANEIIIIDTPGGLSI